MREFRIIEAENGEKYTAEYVYDTIWKKDYSDYTNHLTNIIIYKRGECVFNLNNIIAELAKGE